MPSNRITSRATVVLRAALLVIGLLGVAGVVGVAGIGPFVGRSHTAQPALLPPEAPLLAVVSTAAVASLLAVTVVVLRTAIGIVRAAEPGTAVAGSGRLQRLVAGLLLGAGSLAPQLASAATLPAVHGGQVATATLPTAARGVGVGVTVPADDGPVDPTYLGPGSTRPTPPALRPVPAGATTTVHRGDTLWGIAERELARRLPHGSPLDDAAVARTVHALYAANRDAVGADPDLIRPGTTLHLPPEEALR